MSENLSIKKQNFAQQITYSFDMLSEVYLMNDFFHHWSWHNSTNYIPDFYFKSVLQFVWILYLGESNKIYINIGYNQNCAQYSSEIIPINQIGCLLFIINYNLLLVQLLMHVCCICVMWCDVV